MLFNTIYDDLANSRDEDPRWLSKKFDIQGVAFLTGLRPYMWYAEGLSKTYNAVDRTFCDAIIYKNSFGLGVHHILRRSILLLCISFLFLCNSCGYYNPYADDSITEPISIHRTMWNNETNELGLETVFYHSLSDWLRKTKLVELKEKDEIAKYQLTGKISKVDYPEISYGGNNIAIELRVYLTVQYQLVEQSSGNIILQTSKVYTEPFPQALTPSLAQANKDVALAEIADNISEEIYLLLITKAVHK